MIGQEAAGVKTVYRRPSRCRTLRVAETAGDSFLDVGLSFGFRQGRDDGAEYAGQPKGLFLLERDLRIGHAGLRARVSIPAPTVGWVLVAPDTRATPRSRLALAVSDGLNRAGIATLLVDLCTRTEARGAVPGPALLTERFIALTSWLRDASAGRLGPMGYFAEGPAATAALLAARELGPGVSAVVSWHGWRSFSGDPAGVLTAPTLLVVDADNPSLFEVNRQAREQLRCSSEIVVVSDGAPELATRWLARHLGAQLPCDSLAGQMQPVGAPLDEDVPEREHSRTDMYIKGGLAVAAAFVAFFLA